MKNNVFESIYQRVQKTIRGYSLKEQAKYIEDRVRARVRLGYGVSDGERGGARERLKEWKNKNKRKAVRARDERLNRSITTPGKNNLTLTGQLLDSIYAVARGAVIIMGFKNNRNDGVKNTDIAKGQAGMGRHFFELTDKELKGLRSAIKKDLIKELKKRKK